MPRVQVGKLGAYFWCQHHFVVTVTSLHDVTWQNGTLDAQVRDRVALIKAQDTRFMRDGFIVGNNELRNGHAKETAV